MTSVQKKREVSHLEVLRTLRGKFFPQERKIAQEDTVFAFGKEPAHAKLRCRRGGKWPHILQKRGRVYEKRDDGK